MNGIEFFWDKWDEHIDLTDKELDEKGFSYYVLEFLDSDYVKKEYNEKVGNHYQIDYRVWERECLLTQGKRPHDRFLCIYEDFMELMHKHICLECGTIVTIRDDDENFALFRLICPVCNNVTKAKERWKDSKELVVYPFKYILKGIPKWFDVLFFCTLSTRVWIELADDEQIRHTKKSEIPHFFSMVYSEATWKDVLFCYTWKHMIKARKMWRSYQREINTIDTIVTKNIGVFLKKMS